MGLSHTEGLTTAAEILANIAGAEPDIDISAGRVSVPARDRVDTLTRVIRALDEAGLPVDDIALRRPTLDEVFVHLTTDTPAQAATVGQRVTA